MTLIVLGSYVNRMILLIDGKNYIEGTFDEISKSEDPKVKAFFQIK